MKVCVLMITMNEEKAIAPQVDAIRRHAGKDTPILIVDSSKDDTPKIAESLGVEVVRQFPPQGYGKAMLLGQHAAAERHDAVLTMDCDMTYPAEDIPKFIRLLEDGYDCVSGSRIQPGAAMPLLNRVGNIGFAGLARVMFGLKTKDLTTGMRAYRSEVINSIDWVPLRFFPAEQAIRIHQAGFKILEVPVEYRVRIGDVKMQKIRDTLALLEAFEHCRRVPVTRRKVGA